MNMQLLMARARMNHQAAPTGGAWNPADKAPQITLSNANRTMQTSAGWTAARGAKPQAAGKRIIEFAVTDNISKHSIGVANSACTLAAYPGSTADAWAHLSDGYKAHSGYSAYGTPWSTTGRMRVAVDLAAGKMWFGTAVGWMASGDPATGTNPAFTGLSGLLYPIGGVNGGGVLLTAYFDAADLTIALPAGFVAWNA